MTFTPTQSMPEDEGGEGTWAQTPVTWETSALWPLMPALLGQRTDRCLCRLRGYWRRQRQSSSDLRRGKLAQRLDFAWQSGVTDHRKRKKDFLEIRHQKTLETIAATCWMNICHVLGKRSSGRHTCVISRPPGELYSRTVIPGLQRQTEGEQGEVNRPRSRSWEGTEASTA